MKLGLVYLPDAETSRLCVDYAALVSGVGGRKSTLGEGAFPHASLIHVDSEFEVESAWDEAIAKVSATIEISLFGLAFLPDRHTGGSPVTAWVTVNPSEALRASERAAVALDWATAGTITTLNGDFFQPHITLATMEQVPGGVPLPVELLARKRIECRLALGPIGPGGIFQEALFRA